MCIIRQLDSEMGINGNFFWLSFFAPLGKQGQQFDLGAAGCAAAAFGTDGGLLSGPDVHLCVPVVVATVHQAARAPRPGRAPVHVATESGRQTSHQSTCSPYCSCVSHSGYSLSILNLYSFLVDYSIHINCYVYNTLLIRPTAYQLQLTEILVPIPFQFNNVLSFCYVSFKCVFLFQFNNVL